MNADSRTLIESGAESTVYLVSSPGKHSIIQKSRRPRGTVQYKFEAFAYEALEKLGARVPKVLSVDNDQLEMTALHGETIDDLIDLYDNTLIFSDVARDLALARQVTFKGFGPAVFSNNKFEGSFSSWREYLDVFFEELINSSRIPSAIKETLVEYWSAVSPEVRLNDGMLVHGDFALSAIFVREGAYEGIIDFGDAFIGDPLMDLAYFRFKEITKEYGPKIYSHLLKGYLKVTNLDEQYVESTVRLYMIYWAVKRINAENLEQEIMDKFLDKTAKLAQLLSQTT